MKGYLAGRTLATGALLCAGLATPVLADVKDGVDAWGRGDYASAVREWTGPAQAGDADAQFNLAQAYRLGRGVDTDPEQAEALYARAAAQGHIRAADNYGLLLFQKGAREQAMPYLRNAAGRGDPRAQYLVGLAHFNGDLADKDWPRAYALLTLANATGLPQARKAIAEMDAYIPLADREAAQVLAMSIRAQADANRASELAAVDLALGRSPTGSAQATEEDQVTFAGALPTKVESKPVLVAQTQTARAAPDQSVSSSRPATATVSAPRPAERRAIEGPWKVQLGAFGVPGNVDRMWNKLKASAAIAGRERVTKVSGRLTFLYAGGYASRGEAQAACAAIKRSGNDCLVTK